MIQKKKSILDRFEHVVVVEGEVAAHVDLLAHVARGEAPQVTCNTTVAQQKQQNRIETRLETAHKLTAQRDWKAIYGETQHSDTATRTGVEGAAVEVERGDLGRPPPVVTLRRKLHRPAITARDKKDNRPNCGNRRRDERQQRKIRDRSESYGQKTVLRAIKRQARTQAEQTAEAARNKVTVKRTCSILWA